MLRLIVKIAPAATLTLGFLALALALVLFDPFTTASNGLPALRLDALSHRDAILIVQGVFSLAVLSGGIWAVSIMKKVSRIVREGQEETEAIQQERARKLQQEKRAAYNRAKKKSRR